MKKDKNYIRLLFSKERYGKECNLYKEDYIDWLEEKLEESYRESSTNNNISLESTKESELIIIKIKNQPDEKIKEIREELEFYQKKFNDRFCFLVIRDDKDSMKICRK